eukprot:jgi/Mesen1/1889/ME000143S00940
MRGGRLPPPLLWRALAQTHGPIRLLGRNARSFSDEAAGAGRGRGSGLGRGAPSSAPRAVLGERRAASPAPLPGEAAPLREQASAPEGRAISERDASGPLGRERLHHGVAGEAIYSLGSAEGPAYSAAGRGRGLGLHENRGQQAGVDQMQESSKVGTDFAPGPIRRPTLPMPSVSSAPPVAALQAASNSAAAAAAGSSQLMSDAITSPAMGAGAVPLGPVLAAAGEPSHSVPAQQSPVATPQQVSPRQGPKKGLSASAYSKMLLAYDRVGKQAEVLRVYEEADRAGHQLEAPALAAVLRTCGSTGQVAAAERVFGQLASQGTNQLDDGAYNVMIEIYASEGEILKMEAIVDHMVQGGPLPAFVAAQAAPNVAQPVAPVAAAPSSLSTSPLPSLGPASFDAPADALSGVAASGQEQGQLGLERETPPAPTPALPRASQHAPPGDANFQQLGVKSSPEDFLGEDLRQEIRQRMQRRSAMAVATPASVQEGTGGGAASQFADADEDTAGSLPAVTDTPSAVHASARADASLFPPPAESADAPSSTAVIDRASPASLWGASAAAASFLGSSPGIGAAAAGELQEGVSAGRAVGRGATRHHPSLIDSVSTRPQPIRARSPGAASAEALASAGRGRLGAPGLGAGPGIARGRIIPTPQSPLQQPGGPQIGSPPVGEVSPAGRAADKWYGALGDDVEFSPRDGLGAPARRGPRSPPPAMHALTPEQVALRRDVKYTETDEATLLSAGGGDEASSGADGAAGAAGGVEDAAAAKKAAKGAARGGGGGVGRSQERLEEFSLALQAGKTHSKAFAKWGEAPTSPSSLAAELRGSLAGGAKGRGAGILEGGDGAGAGAGAPRRVIGERLTAAGAREGAGAELRSDLGGGVGEVLGAGVAVGGVFGKEREDEDRVADLEKRSMGRGAPLGSARVDQGGARRAPLGAPPAAKEAAPPLSAEDAAMAAEKALNILEEGNVRDRAKSRRKSIESFSSAAFTERIRSQGPSQQAPGGGARPRRERSSGGPSGRQPRQQRPQREMKLAGVSESLTPAQLARLQVQLDEWDQEEGFVKQLHANFLASSGADGAAGAAGGVEDAAAAKKAAKGAARGGGGGVGRSQERLEEFSLALQAGKTHSKAFAKWGEAPTSPSSLAAELRGSLAGGAKGRGAGILEGGDGAGAGAGAPRRVIGERLTAAGAREGAGAELRSDLGGGVGEVLGAGVAVGGVFGKEREDEDRVADLEKRSMGRGAPLGSARVDQGGARRAPLGAPPAAKEAAPPLSAEDAAMAAEKALNILEEGNVRDRAKSRRKSIESFSSAAFTERIRSQGPSQQAPGGGARPRRERSSGGPSGRQPRQQRPQREMKLAGVSESLTPAQLARLQVQLDEWDQEEGFVKQLHANFLIDLEPEYQMENFLDNPDIAETPPPSLQDFMGTVKQQLLAMGELDSDSEQAWQASLQGALANAHHMDDLVQMYAGSGRATAVQESRALASTTARLPSGVSPEISAFTKRALLTLQNNPSWSFYQKQQMLSRIVNSFSSF